MGLDIWLKVVKEVDVFEANFTHNVTPMWRKAGIYDALYNSDGMTAFEVLPYLRGGLQDMRAKPDEYEALNAPNGWGTYKHALPWLEKLVAAFEETPNGIIGVSK